MQPENEYSIGDHQSPDTLYMQMVENSLRVPGIVVPFIVNDAVSTTVGPFVPGSGVGQADIYGRDAYPMGSACGSPYSWPSEKSPQFSLHCNNCCRLNQVHGSKLAAGILRRNF